MRTPLFALLFAAGLFLPCAQGEGEVQPLQRVGATPWKPFEHYTVARTDGSTIDLYVAKAPTPAPTVVVFGGSKCLPVVMLAEQRTVSALMFFEHLAQESRRVNVVVVEKRGLKSFGPPPESEAQALAWMQSAFEKERLYLKETRVQDGVAVVQALRLDEAFRNVHLLGHSEGADVVSGVCKALEGEGVASAALMAGAGPTRFFESAQKGRRDAGSEGAKAVFDQALRLAAAGTATELEDLQAVSYGMTSSPLDDLRGLKFPVFVAHGDRDQKVPIAAADVFVAELLRDPARQLHYLMLPGTNHGFRDSTDQDRSGDLLAYYVDWVLAGSSGRSVRVGLPE
ncbi:MAG: prolyl oligopeptidase family serine peptidase [Planctomycetes bacterium]|nr:prolyl oligopeptidase family serine peptidase [Planctomycetota bacterium]